MRIDPHPQDFLEIDGWTKLYLRDRGAERPLGEPSAEPTIDKVQAFVDAGVKKHFGPAALVVRQKALLLIQKKEARRRADLRAKWAAEDEQAAEQDLIDTINGVLDFAGTGDPESVPVVQVDEFAEKAAAEADLANYTRDDAEAVIAFAKENGFSRVVDHSYVADGTTRITLVKPLQSRVAQADIQKCLEVNHGQALACSREQRFKQVVEALAEFEDFGGAKLLPAGRARDQLVRRIDEFRKARPAKIGMVQEQSRPLADRHAVAAQPSGP